MNNITTCPACLTRFIVGRAQLKANQGQVKCAKCQHTFDYRKHLESAHEQTVFLSGKSLKSGRQNHRLQLSIALLVLLAFGQVLFFAQTTISSYWPSSQSALIKLCHTLHCRIKLPQNIALVSLDDTELIKNENNAELIKFNGLLSNNAHYLQAYPELALTLTDGNDQILVRKVFSAEEYLGMNQKKLKQGLAASAELHFSINLKTTEPVTGYRAVAVYR